MADYQLDKDGKNIEYMNGGGTDFNMTYNAQGQLVAAGPTDTPAPVQRAMGLFLNGGTGADSRSYPKVDMSLFDQATMCGTCHVGGPFYEQDRQGSRLPARLMMDWGAAMTRTGSPKINPLTTTVWENYDSNGFQTSFPTFAPWAYPQFVNNDPGQGNVSAPNGWVPMNMDMPDPNTGAIMHLTQKQLMMPNVKEMDCLFCHLKGYDNVMASVMVQAGSLNMVPAVGAGFIDMFPLSGTFMGYTADPSKLSIDAATGVVSLSDTALANMLAKPDSNNCMQCHATKRMKDFPEMFGVVGESSGFLSSAPMSYDPPGMGPLGKVMVKYDINAPFMAPGTTSPLMTSATMAGWADLMMPGLPAYPQSGDQYPYARAAQGIIGGGNPGHSGPLYYATPTQADPKQNVLKKSTAVFARAEWFKRGDAWQNGQDLHSTFGCAGCHFTGDAVNKNQCDPGRGFDMMSGIQDSVPPLKERYLVSNKENGMAVKNADGTFTTYSGLQTPAQHDTRNTVKRCDFCHLTGQDAHGNVIDTFGAPNPTAKHKEMGLLANIVQAVVKPQSHGTFGGEGIPATTDVATLKDATALGNHLDVMDCTVCHTQKKSMVVRTLDATSGMRFPSVQGTDPNAGMMGLFEDPAPDSTNIGAAQQRNQMFNAINTFFGYSNAHNLPGTSKYGPMPTAPGYMPLLPEDGSVHPIGAQMQEWKPLRVWQKLGNYGYPLNPGGNGGHLNWRRKIYLANPIVAAIWNNDGSDVDANGDGAKGGLLNNSKPSLDGYVAVFSGAPLDKNNAQGFDEPIFDPWIMRDLKAGFNFGPAPLSVISVGFGGGNSGSAYDADGSGKFSTGNYWKYVSVWSGAVVFTEANQIRDYKNYRNWLKDQPGGDGKSWDKTVLALVGDPFMVTHGVKPTFKHVLGSTNFGGHGCQDCHASGTGFFSGDFTMTGTAIPADRSYDPTSALATTGNPYADSNSYNVVTDAKGDPAVLSPGLSAADPVHYGMLKSASNMMERPLVPYRVKAFKGDLRTSFEGFNKLGQPRTSEFQKEITVQEGPEVVEYTVTKPLSRTDVLYPVEKNADGSPLAIYCKVDDAACANPMTGEAYAAYLETGRTYTKEAFGIGVLPNAIIASISGANVTTGKYTQGAESTLTANTGVNPTGNFTYYWFVDDATGTVANPEEAVVTGPSVTHKFDRTGIFTVTLRVVSEDGNIAISQQQVNVVAPSPLTVGSITTTSGVTSLPITTTGADQVVINWGDGSRSTTYNSSVAAFTATHTFPRTAKYAVADIDAVTPGNQPGYKYNAAITLYNGSTIIYNKVLQVYIAQ